MPAIFTTNGTIINSDHVVKFTELRNGETRFLLSTGDTETAEVRGDINDQFYRIVPATPGHAGVFVRDWGDEVYYTVRSIIAWRICPGGTFPIFVSEGEDLGDRVAIIDPVSGLRDDEGNTGLTLDEWKKIYESQRQADHKEAA
ncbi:hypothetical protein ACUTJJ_11700 [Agrobacterium sp. DKPNP3]|uniref:hypothetical protein n=1 Tax=Agrobacterium sp. DKPNP3 TaxID=3457323 RepID=UPI0040444B50